MANIEVRDGDGLEKYLKATGAGTDLDPFIKEVALGTGTNSIGTVGLDTGSNTIGGVTLSAGENHLGSVAGNTKGFPGISDAYTRPANTTAYSAGDSLSDSTSSPTTLNFADVVRNNGDSGYITGARLQVSNTSFDGKIVLYLYNTTQSATNDNAALTLTASTDFVGWIEFDGANIKGSGTTVAYVEGDLPNSRLIPFVADAADTDLYGIVGVATGFTPTSGGTFTFYLAVEQN